MVGSGRGTRPLWRHHVHTLEGTAHCPPGSPCGTCSVTCLTLTGSEPPHPCPSLPVPSAAGHGAGAVTGCRVSVPVSCRDRAPQTGLTGLRCFARTQGHRSRSLPFPGSREGPSRLIQPLGPGGPWLTAASSLSASVVTCLSALSVSVFLSLLRSLVIGLRAQLNSG